MESMMKKIFLIFTFIMFASWIFSNDFIKVEGRVVSQDGLRPVSGVKIQAQYEICGCAEPNDDFMRFTSSKEDGSFTLILPKTNRDYSIYFSSTEGYIFSVYGGIYKNIDLGTIRLPQMCKLKGRVFDNEAKTLQNVTLIARMKLHYTRCPIYKEVSRTRTDRKGNFMFKNLSQAEYKIRIISNEFAQIQQSVHVTKNCKYVELYTCKGALIHGRVTDPSDQPVAGLMVEINPFFSSYTDQNGYYKIGGLKTGRYEINVCRMGYGLPFNKAIKLNISSGQERTYHIQVAHTGKLRIHIKAKENTVVPDSLWISLDDDNHPHMGYSNLKTKVISNSADFENIVPGYYTISTKNSEFPEQTAKVIIKPDELTKQTITVSPSFVFKGKVLNEEGTPLFDASIELTEKSHKIHKYVRSDRSGNFIIKGILPGQYKLEINHHQAIGIEKEIQIMKKKFQSKTYVLKTGATVSGQVLNENHVPLDDARIEIEGIMPPSNFSDVAADEKGKFNISGLRPGWVWIRISEKHSVPKSIKVFVNNKTFFKEPFVLKSGLSLNGRVVDEDGKPIGDARINCYIKGMHRNYKSVRTDYRGSFSLKGLLLWTINLKIEKDEFIPFEKDIQFKGESCKKPFVFTIKKGLRISGKVLEADGTACDNIEVDVIGVRTRRSSRCIEGENVTDTTGYFIQRGLTKGLYSLTIKDKNTHNLILTMKDIPAGKEDVIVTLPKKYVMSGVVTDSMGKPVSDAKIQVFRMKRGQFGQNFSTNSNGRFQIELRHGSIYKLSFLHGSYLPYIQKVDLTTSSIENEKILNIVLKSGFSISGTVVKEYDNTPIGNISVSLSKNEYPLDSPYFETEKVTKTNNNGAFEIKGVSPGVTNIYVYKSDKDEMLLAKKQVLVEKKDITNIKIKIKIRETGSVKVQLVFDNGLPASDCHVELFDLNRGIPSFICNVGKTDENGVYIFNNVLTGKYLVGYINFDENFSELNKLVPVSVEKNKISEVIIGKPNDIKGMGISGCVSKDGQPLKSGQICFFPAGKKKITKENIFDLIKQMKQANINKKGKFIINGLQPGNYLYGIENIKEEKGLSFGGWIEIDDSQKSINIDIKVIKLTGVVTGLDGCPVSGAIIRVSIIESNELLKEILSSIQFTDKNGKYEINYIVPGQYDISVKHSKWGYIKKNGVKLQNRVEELNFHLSKGFSLSGSIKTHDKSPAKGAYIFVMTESGAIIAYTEVPENGKYKMDKVLPKGRYSVLTYFSGYAIDVKSIAITQDLVQDVNLTLGGNLEVILKGPPLKIVNKNILVKTQKGEEISRLKINGLMIGRGVSYFTIQPTDSEGRTKIFGLKPGIYTISIQGTSLSKEVKIIALETVTCELEI